MSVEEEADLRAQLADRQRELDECPQHMKGMTPVEKKRLRNRHASCVSRLKKKIYIGRMQRRLDATTEALRRSEAALHQAQTELHRFAGFMSNGAGAGAGAGAAPMSQHLASKVASKAMAAAQRAVEGVSRQTSRGAECICNMSTAGDSSDMVQCDTCQRWYHCGCVGLTKAQAEAMPSYRCLRC